ncbi:hypothetical protein KEM56_005108, partial [Ascosphaera pollenicola]
VYDPASDHRRKGVYKKDIANLQNRNATLQTLIHAILTYDEDDVIDLIRQMRSSKSLEELAASITERQKVDEQIDSERLLNGTHEGSNNSAPIEDELSGKMNQLRLDGSVKLIGGTSNLLFLPRGSVTDSDEDNSYTDMEDDCDDPITRWTNVAAGRALIVHLLNLYFTWHYGYFTILSRERFERDFFRGHISQNCSPLLVNAILAIGCHFSSLPGARENPNDPSTVGDHFFREAKRLILENDEHERAKICTVQALALMSVREAGCGREGSGWVYSGMSFRMALDLGLNVDPTELDSNNFTPEELDTRRVTFWGCFLIDKYAFGERRYLSWFYTNKNNRYWSNYLGRQAQLTNTNMAVAMFDVFPEAESAPWFPYVDSSASLEELKQPARTRTIVQQMIRLSEISDDLLATFYHPAANEKSMGRHEQARHLNRIYKKLNDWKLKLPQELQLGNTLLPSALLMHMFHQLLFIHLYRPFLKHTRSSQPIPPPATARSVCSQAAFAISEILQIYRDTYGLRYICNVAVYTIHSACTIHLLSLPEKAAGLQFINGLRGLEEIAEGWPCARRALRIIDLSSAKWGIGLPCEAEEVLQRSYSKFGPLGAFDHMRSVNGRRLSTASTLHRQSSKASMESGSTSVTPYPSPPVVSSAEYDQAVQPTNQYQTSFPTPLPGTTSDAQQLMAIAFSNATPETPFAAYQNQGTLPLVGYVAGTYPTITWTTPTIKSTINHEQRNQANNDALDTHLPLKAATMQGEQQLAGSSNYWWLNDQAAFAYRLEN